MSVLDWALLIGGLVVLALLLACWREIGRMQARLDGQEQRLPLERELPHEGLDQDEEDWSA